VGPCVGERMDASVSGDWPVGLRVGARGGG
jgi:hypothetical protein